MNPGDIPKVILVAMPLKNCKDFTGGFQHVPHFRAVSNAVIVADVEPLMSENDDRFRRGFQVGL